MSFLRDLAQGRTTFDFVGKRMLWFRISAVLVVISLGFLVFRGLNLGIEFRGGTTINANNLAGATVPDLRELTDAAGVDGAVIQLVDGGESVRVQTPSLDPDIESELIDDVANITGTERADISIDSIGPSFGALILRQSVVALVVFLIAVALFMSWRLEWKMAGAGLAALVHDLIITVGIYSITWFEVTPATVIALLTILGYSLYDTVVVFDKVTELVADLGERMNYSDIVNRAMNMVLGRSLNTSLTSLLPVGSVLFVGSFLFGATALRDFALALFVGLAASTYSSIFVAAPILAVWKEGDEEWTTRRRRLAAKSAAAGSVRTGARTASRPNRPRPPKGRR
ncbi:MAG: protein translocase subunit SecF [Actinobacteria bacterium]|nr:protein translocase subunit SecF [Actinomycetota bacterium]